MSEQSQAAVGGFEVAVAFVPLVESGDGRPAARQEYAEESLPGISDASGWRSRGQPHAQRTTVLEKGEDVLQRATEALAGQIGLTAQRIADAIGRQETSPPAIGAFELDTVEVSFGITLSAGVQTVFTAQGQSSVQVTISLTRLKQETTNPSQPAGRQ
jgi:hypothetical protein